MGRKRKNKRIKNKQRKSLMTTTPKENNVIDLGHSNLDLKIEIDSLVYQKVMHFVDKSEYEVSGLGKIVKDKETNTLRVVSAIILPQENTRSHTEIAGEAVAKAMYELRNEPGLLKWWWHSHVKMDVFWSGEDLGTIKEISDGGWFAATVFNQHRKMRSAYRQVDPVTLMVDHLPTYVNAQIDEETKKQWDDDYEKNVTNKVYSYITGPKGGRIITPDQIREYFNYSPHNRSYEENDGEGNISLEELFNDESEPVGEENTKNLDLLDLVLLWQNDKMSDEEFGEYAVACFADSDQLIHLYDRGIIDDGELVRLARSIDEDIEWVKDEQEEDFVPRITEKDDDNVLSNEEAVAMDLANGSITEEEAEKILKGAKDIDDGSDVLV